LSKKEEDPKPSWEPEDLEVRFEDITPRHRERFPKDIDENTRTEATFRETPV
jgi:hypothetical protein